MTVLPARLAGWFFAAASCFALLTGFTSALFRKFFMCWFYRKGGTYADFILRRLECGRPSFETNLSGLMNVCAGRVGEVGVGPDE